MCQTRENGRLRMASQPILSESFFSFISIHPEFTRSSLDSEAHLSLKQGFAHKRGHAFWAIFLSLIIYQTVGCLISLCSPNEWFLMINSRRGQIQNLFFRLAHKFAKRGLIVTNAGLLNTTLNLLLVFGDAHLHIRIPHTKSHSNNVLYLEFIVTTLHVSLSLKPPLLCTI